MALTKEERDERAIKSRDLRNRVKALIEEKGLHVEKGLRNVPSAKGNKPPIIVRMEPFTLDKVTSIGSYLLTEIRVEEGEEAKFQVKYLSKEQGYEALRLGGYNEDDLDNLQFGSAVSRLLRRCLGQIFECEGVEYMLVHEPGKSNQPAIWAYLYRERGEEFMSQQAN